jgi:4-hydroxybenzoate polyprenyltransferase
MSYGTAVVLKIPVQTPFLLFLFFGTLSCYNFHSYLTPLAAASHKESPVLFGTKPFQLTLFAASLVVAAYFAFQLQEIWAWLMAGAVGAFLYSAPKIPHRSAALLKNIALGKTIFLAFGWTYATAFLPCVPFRGAASQQAIAFSVNRFFLIYAICILFDYRDRQQDLAAGIKSLVTNYDERGIDVLFWSSWCAFFLSIAGLYLLQVPATVCLLLLVPGLVLIPLYAPSKKSKDFYLYYFVLDGLMMLSGLLLLLKNTLP